MRQILSAKQIDAYLKDGTVLKEDKKPCNCQTGHQCGCPDCPSKKRTSSVKPNGLTQG